MCFNEHYSVGIKCTSLNMAEADDLDIMGAHETDVRRITFQHDVITESAGKLAFAPVDLSKSGLKILVWSPTFELDAVCDAYVFTEIGSQLNPELYSTLVKNTTIDVAFQALQLLGPIEVGLAVHDNGYECLEAARVCLKGPQAANITIAATDADPLVVNRAKEISAAQNWHNVTVSNMPAEALTFPDNHFSQSISNTLVFMTANDGVDCAKKIYRTLKPGTTAAITTWATIPHDEPVENVPHALPGKDAELCSSFRSSGKSGRVIFEPS